MMPSSKFDDNIESVTHATNIVKRGRFHGRAVQGGNPSITNAKAGTIYVYNASDSQVRAHDSTWYPLGQEHGFNVFISNTGNLMKKVATLSHIQADLRFVYYFSPTHV